MLDVKLNVLDVKSLPGMKVAIVEVSKRDKSRGNIELKVKNLLSKRIREQVLR